MSIMVREAMKKRLLYSVFCTLYSATMAMGLGAQITQGGAAYSIATPYQTEDLFQLQFVQTKDVMYLVHNDYAPRKLSRFTDTNWTLEVLDFTGGPFLDRNKVEATTMTPSAKTGAITLTAAADVFVPGHVGALWRIEHLVDANSINGTFETTGSSATLEVQAGRIFDLTTENVWSGTIKLERSYDSGSTWRDASKVFNINTINDGQIHYIDQETIANALYRVTATAYSTGTIGYTLSARSGEFSGIVEITSVSDARTAAATVETDFDLVNTSATFRWYEGAWSTENGYPGSVALFQERLVFGGSLEQPQTVWASQTNDWTNMYFDGLPTSAMAFTIASGQAETIQWLVGHTAILIGTDGAEWKLKGGDSKLLTFNDFDISRQSTNGSAKVQPVAVNSQIIYPQRNAEKIYQQQFAFERDNWISTDISLLAEHITAGGVTQMAYQRTPRATLWLVRADGQLLGVAMEETEEVIGWYRYVFDGQCESVAVISGATEDQVWVVIKRTVDSTVTRYVEQFQPINYDEQADGFFVDAGLTFRGVGPFTITNISQADPAVVTATDHTFTDGEQVRFSTVGGMTEVNNEVFTVSTVSGSTFQLRDVTDTVDINSVDFTTYSSGGSAVQVENHFVTLTHLEGETVTTSGDGGYAGSYTVASGTITVTDYYTVVHAGLAYTAKLKPMNLEFASTGGALQGLTKRIDATNIRFDRSLSCSVGPTFDQFDTYQFRTFADALEGPPPLFTGDLRMLFDGPFDRQGSICIQDSKPVPLTVVSLIAEYEVGRN
ncbi:MAG: ubiquitin-activating E1 FCCH domain-containing protein [Dehalococcoidales bacterium]